MRIHFRGRTEEKMRRSKIVMACWVVAALFLDPKFPGADEAKKTLEGLK